MRIPMFCTVCFREDNLKLYGVDVTNDGHMTYTCDYGHENHAAVHNERYELLYDSGALALMDGYPREAVASFAASVERFHEAVLRALVSTRKISAEDFEKVWKPMKKLSERQLGAFRMVYLTVVGRPSPELPDKWIKQRNDVVHNGDFPSYNDVMEFGQTALDYIRSIKADLRPVHRLAMSKLKEAAKERRLAKVTSGIRRQHLYISVINSVQFRAVGEGEDKLVSLKEWIDTRREHNDDLSERVGKVHPVGR